MPLGSGLPGSANHQVWRYELPITDEHYIDMPKGATVLTAQRRYSDSSVDVWAMVEPDQLRLPVRFRVVGTGHRLDTRSGWRYISTVQVLGGAGVFHVFVEAGA